jgi:hypothetical protein
MAPVARVSGPAAEAVMLDLALAAKLGIALACIAVTLLMVVRAPRLNSVENRESGRIAVLLPSTCRPRRYGLESRAAPSTTALRFIGRTA